MSFEQRRRPAILILTGNFGDGHRQAAQAMAEAAVRLNPNAEARVVDVMERSLPRLHRLTQACYMLWITKTPWLYGYLFRKTKDDTWMAKLFKKFRLCSLDRIRDLLKEMNPSVVVCTFPAAAAGLSTLKARGETDVPMVTVITDHTYHSYWIHPGTNRYIVGSDHVRQALLRWQLPDRQIAVTGIPIRPAFREPMDRLELSPKYSLDPAIPTVMIMGGGNGLIGSDWAKLLTDPRLIRKPVQVLIICGRNDKLKDQLTRELKGYPHKLIITGYVEHVHELMAVSDLLITKPGGLTTSEALASELPMLLYKPLPGQEYDNAAYLTAAGAAVQAGSPEEFALQLELLISQPQALARMKANAANLGNRNSAEQGLANIYELAHSPAAPIPLPKARYAEA